MRLIAQFCILYALKFFLFEQQIEVYGSYKAKVSLSVLQRLKDQPNGRLVLDSLLDECYGKFHSCGIYCQWILHGR